MVDNAAKRLSAVVLAGGISTSADNQRAESARERVIEHLAWTLVQFPFARFALIGADAGSHGRLEALPDDHNGVGPAEGIATALRHLRGGILVTAGNMPFVSAEMIEWLLGHDDAKADAVIPRHAGGVEPFFAIYNTSVLSHLEKALRSDGGGFGGALEKDTVRYIDVPERFSARRDFTRVHTPQEYEQALATLEKKVSR